MIKVTYVSTVDGRHKVAMVDEDKEMVVQDTTNNGELVDVEEGSVTSYGVIPDGGANVGWGTVYYMLKNGLAVPYKERLGLNIEGIDAVDILKLELV